MSQKFFAFMGEGKEPLLCSDARRFSHYVHNVRFWFAVHPSVNDKTKLTVSHFSTGMRVCEVPSTVRAARPGADWPEVARRALDLLCQEKTHARVYDVLCRAESQAYGMLSARHA